MDHEPGHGKAAGRDARRSRPSARPAHHGRVAPPYEIQGYHVHGLDAIYQVVEHFGMHFGQIVYIAKLLSGKDLGFYKELSQTGRA
jgi:hypothetical protein